MSVQNNVCLGLAPFANRLRPRQRTGIRAVLCSCLLAGTLGLQQAEAAPATPSGRVVTAVADGNWSQPATWSTGSVPAAGDDVIVPAGRTVTYDLNSQTSLNTVTVQGTVQFSTQVSTTLNAGFIKIGADARDLKASCNGATPAAPASGSLFLGRPGAPVPRGITATVGLVPFSGQNTDEGPGLINCGGRLTIEGAAIKNPWTRLSASALVGAKTLTVADDISDWQVGDTVIVVGTNNSKGNFSDSPPSYRDIGTDTEQRTITAISGKTITLNSALNENHDGVDGNYPEVANLTRTVVVRSTDTSSMANRGHTMYHAHSSGSVAYAQFDGLGKEAKLGRYPIHLHLVSDTMRGFSVVGAAITNGGNKFISIHGTNFALLRDNVGYRTNTSGYFLEDATEVYNVLDRNLAVNAFDGTPAPNETLQFLTGDGFGFWWANGRNTFINNQSAENDSFGYFFELQRVKQYYGQTYPDLRLVVAPMQQPNGSFVDTTINTVPFYRFDGNSCHNEKTWCFQVMGGNWTPSQPSVIKNFRSWTTHYALSLMGSGVLVDNWKAVNTNYGAELKYNYDAAESWMDNNVTFRNFTIDGAGSVALNLEAAGENVVFQNGSIRKSAPIWLPNFSDEAKPSITLTGVTYDYTGSWVQARDERPSEGNTAVVHIHDHYGPGRAAKVIRSDRSLSDGLSYSQKAPAGYLAKAAETSNNTNFSPLNPIDSLPPATAITSLGALNDNLQVALAADGSLTLEGVSTDNAQVQSVTVNGIAATPLVSDYSRWQVKLTGLTPGSFTVTATAVDAALNAEQNPHSVTLNLVASNGQSAPLAIGTSSLPAGTVNQPYSTALAASGGQAPYTWSLAGGSLPAGLTLAASGTISGTPTAAGSLNFTAQLTDAASTKVSKALTLTVAAAPPPPPPPPSGGTNLALSGTPIVSVTTPTGGGNKSFEVIRDGDKPPVGTSDSLRQYDTFNGKLNKQAWVGYRFSGSQTFGRIVFQEGMHFKDGGWFDGQFKVQVRQNGKWVDLAATVAPAYPGSNDNTSYQTYTLTFSPVQGDAIRLIGKPGGPASFISVGELEVYAQ